MLNKRDDRSFSSIIQSSSNSKQISKQEFIKKFMLDPENIQQKEAFILKYYTDYEYPDSQVYLKTFWKNLVSNTLAHHFNSFSGKNII